MEATAVPFDNPDIVTLCQGGIESLQLAYVDRMLEMNLRFYFRSKLIE